MKNRRRFLKTVSVMSLLQPAQAARPAAPRDYFKELGVRPIINACGNYTRYSASLMPKEVLEAMEYASKRYVRLNDLQDAVGARIAALAGSESAMVTAGAASAISLGTTACMTGKNPDFIHRIPDTTGMKSSVILPKGHRNSYDHAVRACGAKLVEVETIDELDNAVNADTAMLAFYNLHEPAGRITSAELAAAGKRHGIPSLIDAAADIPPIENLTRFTKMGFDLVCISGGKAINGPQSAGMLLGRRDLIEAAKLNTSPYSASIHRGMKVNKEEILGMLVALETFLKRDHAADHKEWLRRVDVIAAKVKQVPGVSAELWIPPIASHMPHVKVRWQEASVRRTVKEAIEDLRAEDPPIEVNLDSKEELILAVWTLQSGEEKILANRLHAILKRAAV